MGVTECHIRRGAPPQDALKGLRLRPTPPSVPQVNEDPTAQLIRELQEELASIKNAIQQGNYEELGLDMPPGAEKSAAVSKKVSFVDLHGNDSDHSVGLTGVSARKDMDQSESTATEQKEKNTEYAGSWGPQQPTFQLGRVLTLISPLVSQSEFPSLFIW